MDVFRWLHPRNLTLLGLRFLIWKQGELPWWISGKQSTLQYKGHWFHPLFRKIPHAMEQLSLCTTTVEPVNCSYWAWVPQLLKCSCLEPVLCNKGSHCSGRPHTVTKSSLPHHTQGGPTQGGRAPMAKNKTNGWNFTTSKRIGLSAIYLFIQ